MNSTTTLYRAFDSAGRLLYVGISHDALLRIGQHCGRTWARHAASITFERFDSRAEAAAAELAAIRNEDPVFNMAGRPQTRWLQWLAAYPSGDPDEIDADALANEVLAGMRVGGGSGD